jgi:hypothetical protein
MQRLSLQDTVSPSVREKASGERTEAGVDSASGLAARRVLAAQSFNLSCPGLIPRAMGLCPICA